MAFTCHWNDCTGGHQVLFSSYQYLIWGHFSELALIPCVLSSDAFLHNSLDVHSSPQLFPKIGSSYVFFSPGQLARKTDLCLPYVEGRLVLGSRQWALCCGVKVWCTLCITGVRSGSILLSLSSYNIYAGLIRDQ